MSVSEQIAALLEQAAPLRLHDPDDKLPALVDEINRLREIESGAPSVVVVATQEGADAKPLAPIAIETRDPEAEAQAIEAERAELIARAAAEGKKIDGRWGLARLREVFA